MARTGRGSRRLGWRAGRWSSRAGSHRGRPGTWTGGVPYGSSLPRRAGRARSWPGLLGAFAPEPLGVYLDDPPRSFGLREVLHLLVVAVAGDGRACPGRVGGEGDEPGAFLAGQGPVDFADAGVRHEPGERFGELAAHPGLMFGVPRRGVPG